MNFFGHAAIAGRFERDPVFVLGAMLPDFYGMLGLRPPEPAAGPLGAGVRFHHVTDHAFHELPRFRTLYRDATAELDALGVRRGTARAVAHVGVELMLDAELAENDESRLLYFSALHAAAEPATLAAGTLASDDHARLLRLTRTLGERGVAKKPASTAIVERLERALSGRSRLAVSAADVPRVTEWVEVFRGRVVASAGALVADLMSDIARRLTA